MRKDFSKEFDTVEYPTLVKQLHNLGFSNRFISVIDDYLNLRYYRFKLTTRLPNSFWWKDQQ